MYFGRRTPFLSKFILTIKFVLQIAVRKCCREASFKSDELSVNEFSFLTKLLTVTVCRQSVLISTSLELLSTALNCRIIIKLLHIGSLEPDQSFNSLSTVPWLAGDNESSTASSVVRRSSSQQYFTLFKVPVLLYKLYGARTILNTIIQSLTPHNSMLNMSLVKHSVTLAYCQTSRCTKACIKCINTKSISNSAINKIKTN